MKLVRTLALVLSLLLGVTLGSAAHASPTAARDESQHHDVVDVTRRLQVDANALAVALVGPHGHVLVHHGNSERLERLLAGEANDGSFGSLHDVLEFLRSEWSQMVDASPEGSPHGEHLHLSRVEHHAALLVFYNDSSSLGLVRLRVKRATVDLLKIFEAPSAP